MEDNIGNRRDPGLAVSGTNAQLEQLHLMPTC